MISPRSEYHRNKLLNPQVKPNMEKITVEEALLFADWLHGRYDRISKGWIISDARENKGRIYTTRELWNLYQQFLGRK